MGWYFCQKNVSRFLRTHDIIHLMTRTNKKATAVYLRNFIFGVEDSLVSTVGLLAGIAVAEVPRATIFLTGMVLIFVEAFSMAIGSLVSEITADEYLKNRVDVKSTKVGALMFLSYFIAGFIPLSPYSIFERQTALWFSVLASLVALFLLGYFNITKKSANSWRKGLRMLFLGGIAIAAGVLVGYALK